MGPLLNFLHVLIGRAALRTGTLDCVGSAARVPRPRASVIKKHATWQAPPRQPPVPSPDLPPRRHALSQRRCPNACLALTWNLAPGIPGRENSRHGI